MHHIVIVGTGYVGLVTGTCLAEMGNHVCCLDKNQDKIHALQQGMIPIYEPGLEEMVRRSLKAGRLRFTSDYQEALQGADVCFLAVDTPVAHDGSCDLKSIERAAQQVAKSMSHDLLIVIKSTVPVGTNQRVRSIVAQELAERAASFTFDVVSNPEFLKEGSAVADFMKPDRVVIGTENENSAHIMRELYRPFMLGSDRLFFMDPASAELTKYAANVMLALRISFMNWLSGFCESVGANILQIRKGIGADKRIGNAFLWAGAGFGGSCFPKDLKALRHMAASCGLSTSLVDAIEEINTQQKQLIGKKIKRYFGEQLQGKTIGILGLAFKPDTDDMREASSLILIQQMLFEGANLRLFDPVATENAKKIFLDHPAITWCRDEIETADQADALVLMTEWKQFRLLDFETIRKTMRGQAFFDGRNQYCAIEMAKFGFDYLSIGQEPVYTSEAACSQASLPS